MRNLTCRRKPASSILTARFCSRQSSGLSFFRHIRAPFPPSSPLSAPTNRTRSRQYSATTTFPTRSFGVERTIEKSYIYAKPAEVASGKIPPRNRTRVEPKNWEVSPNGETIVVLADRSAISPREPNSPASRIGRYSIKILL